MSSKKNTTRELILAATAKLMQENRGTGAKMQDIAKTAGISRQALYLHFESRAELLIGATRYLDDQLGADQKYAAVKKSVGGVERLDALIEFWGKYVPGIYGIAKALIASKETDQAAKAAWDDRMEAVMNLCRDVVKLLKDEGNLSDDWSAKDATQFLWTLLSIPNWEQLTIDCGWSVNKYVSSMQVLAKRSFTKN
jgi:AcrR family transcriptional regulator